MAGRGTQMSSKIDKLNTEELHITTVTSKPSKINNVCILIFYFEFDTRHEVERRTTQMTTITGI